AGRALGEGFGLDALQVGEAETHGRHGPRDEARLALPNRVGWPTAGRRTLRMGQERFAEVVERFTQGYAAPPPAPEVLTRWTDEFERARLRASNFARQVLDPSDPRPGPTP